MSSISIHRVSKKFGATFALNDVSFEVPNQSIFGLVGPNGAGKTTLFSLVASFLRPTTGSIKVLGIDVSEISKLRGRLSILPQDAQFQGNVPIWNQLVFFAELSGRTRKEAEKDAMKSLEIVRLADAAKKNARTLSHGMAKRLGIAQAFLGQPEVILLDEPTAGLDPANVANIKNLINELKGSSTIVLSSHDLSDIQEMCGDVAIMHNGTLKQASKMSEITEGGKYLRIGFARPLTDEEIKTVLGVDGLKEIKLDTENTYIAVIQTSPTCDADEIIANITSSLIATKAIPRSIEQGMNLERKFLELTNK